MPGKRELRHRPINNLYRHALGVHSSRLALHASGHASRESSRLSRAEQRAALLRPVHGEYRPSPSTAELPLLGMPPTVSPSDNGERHRWIRGQSRSATRRAPSGYVLRGLPLRRGGPATSVLRDRKPLAQDASSCRLAVRRSTARGRRPDITPPASSRTPSHSSSRRGREDVGAPSQAWGRRRRSVCQTRSTMRGAFLYPDPAAADGSSPWSTESYRRPPASSNRRPVLPIAGASFAPRRGRASSSPHTSHPTRHRANAVRPVAPTATRPKRSDQPRPAPPRQLVAERRTPASRRSARPLVPRASRPTTARIRRRRAHRLGTGRRRRILASRAGGSMRRPVHDGPFDMLGPGVVIACVPRRPRVAACLRRG